MTLSASKVMLVGLVEITLPTKTIRLCDGGFVYKDGQKFSSSDDEFGSIETIDPITEGASDEAPAGTISFLPSSAVAAGTLSKPSFQNSPIRMWQAEVSEATGNIVGTPELLFDGLLDTTELRSSRGTRTLEMGYISRSERLFLINEGNVLSPRFHKSNFPDETGLDNATGLTLNVAWGIQAPPRGVSSSGGGGSGGGANRDGSGLFSNVLQN